MNLRLRYAIDRAKAASMPKDNIDRAVKKGSGELDGVSLEELLYEGYIEGVAVLIDALTDNRNRTAPEVKKVFEKRGGHFASKSGAAAQMFQRKAFFVVPRSECALSEDEMLEIVLDAGAEDLVMSAETFEITAEATDFHAVATGLEAKSIRPSEARVGWYPTSTIPVADAKKAKKVLDLIEALDDLEDVTSVSANYDIAEAVLEEHANG